MSKIHIGINLEFVRHHDKPFEWAVEKAAELGYTHVEPMVHWGRELLSEAGYFHSVSMLDDPLRIKRACARAGVKLSGLSSHTPLTKPEIGTEYLKQAIRFAAECGAPVVNTDEGPKAGWTTEDEDFVLIRYTLMEASKVAEPRGILIGLECHQQYSKHPDGLDCIQRLVKSPSIGINFDTGNFLRLLDDPSVAMEKLAKYVFATHIKDLKVRQGVSPAEWFFFSSTPVGAGLIDMAPIVRSLAAAGYEGLLAVEIDHLHPDYGYDEHGAVRQSIAELHRLVEAAEGDIGGSASAVGS